MQMVSAPDLAFGSFTREIWERDYLVFTEHPAKTNFFWQDNSLLLYTKCPYTCVSFSLLAILFVKKATITTAERDKIQIRQCAGYAVHRDNKSKTVLCIPRSLSVKA